MSGDEPDDCVNSSDLLLERLAGELVALAVELTAIQEALAEFIDRSPPEPDMARRLQAIDIATQTADNLARVVAAMARSHPAPPDSHTIRAGVGMKALADRLLRSVQTAEGEQSMSKDTSAKGPSEICWL